MSEILSATQKAFSKKILNTMARAFCKLEGRPLSEAFQQRSQLLKIYGVPVFPISFLGCFYDLGNVAEPRILHEAFK